jgi:hypothetical protein
MARIRSIDATLNQTGQASRPGTPEQSIQARLWQLTDALLRRLSSGEIRVPAAERLVGPA